MVGEPISPTFQLRTCGPVEETPLDFLGCSRFVWTTHKLFWRCQNKTPRQPKQTNMFIIVDLRWCSYCIIHLADPWVVTGVLAVPYAFRLTSYWAIPLLLLVVAVPGTSVRFLWNSSPGGILPEDRHSIEVGEVLPFIYSTNRKNGMKMANKSINRSALHMSQNLRVYVQDVFIIFSLCSKKWHWSQDLEITHFTKTFATICWRSGQPSLLALSARPLRGGTCELYGDEEETRASSSVKSGFWTFYPHVHVQCIAK